MNHRQWLGRGAVGLAILASLALGAFGAEKQTRPLAGHPGNVFLEGEEAQVAVPAGQDEMWRLLDYDDKVLSSVRAGQGTLNLGRLPVGFYRLKAISAVNADWISFAVLAPLKARPPETSPVALDVAMSWFYPKEKMPAVANLCALAGVNWVRDRLNWSQMEPQSGQFIASNQYDSSAQAQTEAGLKVLQVIHLSPAWANPNGKRFPLDLRDAYRFFREMARRWQGRVVAFEPWNEADIKMFGGHTGAEMAAMQKASYLGLKAGNNKVIACLNVFALHKQAQLQDLQENEAWPYFDTFNLHHYEAFDKYPGLYADFRAVSAGRPLWVTECALPVKWAGDEKLKEPTDGDLRVQAERVAKTFALSIYEGSAATFYFLLPHYVEGPTQFGIVRPDLTPRPAFVALAAAGRFMADARAIGEVKTPANQRALLFRVQADGKKRELLVAWDNQGESRLALPVVPELVADHLGRLVQPDRALRLTAAPSFAVLANGTAGKMEVASPPQSPRKLSGRPSTVVLQALWPEEKALLDQSAYRLAGKTETVPVWIYNFGSRKVSGRLRVTAPPGWQATLPETMELLPEERKEMKLTVVCPESASAAPVPVRVVGDFGRGGTAVLSVRLVH